MKRIAYSGDVRSKPNPHTHNSPEIRAAARLEPYEFQTMARLKMTLTHDIRNKSPTSTS